ncbi:MAG TPA: methyltransferase domain-containing protein [Vicinamibacterales bacterium]|nr:methyltransferase domain-containing protein [Vicinamibacterales bacterium]
MTDDATERVKRDWESQARSWYEQRESVFTATRPVHEWMVDHLEPSVGQRVLEIAAGPGDTGFLAAGRLGGGQLVSTDIAPAMVDAARRRGAELGVRNAEYRVLDAQRMDLEDGTFDGVLCRWGLMLMPDPAAALRECKRVLVAGGRLVFSVFTAPDENPFASIPARLLIDAGHLTPPTGQWQPGILALADRSRLQALLDAAGFASTHIEPVDMTWSFASADDYWAFLVDLTALGPLVRSLPDASRAALRMAIDRRLETFTGADGIALPSRCWCGVATRGLLT